MQDFIIALLRLTYFDFYHYEEKQILQKISLLHELLVISSRIYLSLSKKSASSGK